MRVGRRGKGEGRQAEGTSERLSEKDKPGKAERAQGKSGLSHI